MTALNQLQAADRTAPPVFSSSNDEISLVDVALVMWRHRLAALVTLLVVSALGLAVALLSPRKYAYTTTIEIGTRVEGGRVVPIETPDAALAKLRESYLPRELQRYREAHPDQRGLFKIEARLPAGSQLLVLEGTATVNQSAAYKGIQEQAVEALAADHARMFEVERSAAESEKRRAERDLQTLVDEESVIKGRMDRLDVVMGSPEQLTSDTGVVIVGPAESRARAVAQSVPMAERRDAMQKALQDNRRNQDLKQAEVQRYDLQLRNLQNTHAVALALQSPRPVGVSRAMVAALGCMLGGLLALLVPLLIEFVDRVRLKAATEDRGRASRQGAVPDAHRHSGA